MSDFIKRSDAVEHVMSILDVNKYYHPHSKTRNVPIDEVVDMINQVPAADLSGWKRIVFCGECDHTQRTDDHEIWCTGRGSPCQLVAPDGFCDESEGAEMRDTTYKSKVGYKPPVELEYHEGTPEIKSVWDNMRDAEGKILDQVEEHVVAQCSAAVGMKIDREELIKALRYDRGQYEKGYADGRFDAADRIDALMEENKMLLNTIPTDKKLMLDHIRKLEQQLPKRGEWIYKPKDAIEMMFTLPKCSVCGHESSDANNYCPNCGAKMTEVQE